MKYSGKRVVDQSTQLEMDRERGAPRHPINFATAYGTRKGVVVEVHGTRTCVYNWIPEPSQSHPSAKADQELPSYNSMSPPTVRTFGNFIHVKHVRITPASRLGKKDFEIWKTDVEGNYRTDPFESSHGPEHQISYDLG